MEFDKIGIVANLKKPEIREVVEKIVEAVPRDSTLIAEEELIKFTGNARLREGEIQECNVVISLGGDGTLLAAARAVEKQEIPILGIKIRSLGFLTEDDPDRAIDSLIKGDYVVQKRLRLEGSLISNGERLQSFTALNDVVVHASGVSRVLRVRTRIDGALLGDYLSDGVIISTPTGSTAYSLAAGGPILNPITVEGFVITPLCPHSLSVRPIVVSSGESFSVEIIEDGERSLVTIDGQKDYPIKEKDNIEFKKSKIYTNLIVTKGYDFYDLVRKKLRWGGVLRER
ncbi:NAD(+) kinase [bacterium]|nr:MAG: NAD(+) kinase [bacterium]